MRVDNMRVAIIGSRSITVNNLEKYIPKNTSEIVSGGAVGVDKCAEKFAFENNIKFTVFLPDYNKYGKAAPLKRNLEIIDYSDIVLAFWDGKSHGTRHVIKKCKEKLVPIKIFLQEF
jgi:hypothetical protein